MAKRKEDVKWFDIEVGTGLGEYVLGMPVGHVKKGWGYIIWDDEGKDVHHAAGYKDEDAAVDAGAKWLDKNVGKGKWAW